jgi:hypothetical protein
VGCADSREIPVRDVMPTRRTDADQKNICTEPGLNRDGNTRHFIALGPVGTAQRTPENRKGYLCTRTIVWFLEPTELDVYS